MQLFEYLVVIDRSGQSSQRRTRTVRRQAGRELADGGSVVIFFNVLAGAGNGHGVQQFEEVEIQTVEERFRSALLGRKFAPGVELPLRLTENLVDGVCGGKFFVPLFCSPLVGQGDLVLEVVEAVVHRSRRKHQHFGTDSRADDPVHQAHITVFPASVIIAVIVNAVAAVSEIVRFVDHDQVVSVPAQTAEVNAVGLASLSGKISMVQHIITETIPSDGVVDVVPLESVPVAGKFFRAQYQYVFVAVLVVFDHRQGGKGFAQPHAVRQNTAVVFFQLVDDRQCRIPLEVVQLFPNQTFAEPHTLIGQHILGNVLQKLAEDVVERDEINEFRSIFPVSDQDVVEHDIGHILHFCGVVPQ